MKYMPLLASLLLALSLPAAGQDPTTLAGTILVGPHTSIDATEVTVEEYTEFIIAKNYDSTLFPASQALPSDSYRSLFADLRKHEHKRSPLNNYPITAITYQQAVRYCQWLEEQANKSRPPFQRIHIFLPSTELYQQLIPNYDTLSQKNGSNAIAPT